MKLISALSTLGIDTLKRKYVNRAFKYLGVEVLPRSSITPSPLVPGNAESIPPSLEGDGVGSRNYPQSWNGPRHFTKEVPVEEGEVERKRKH